MSVIPIILNALNSIIKRQRLFDLMRKTKSGSILLLRDTPFKKTHKAS